MPAANNVERNSICMRVYGFDYRHLCALVAVVTGFRTLGGPVAGTAVRAMVERIEGYAYATDLLPFLLRRGYVRRVGKTATSSHLYIPTTTALQLLPPVAAEVAAE